MASNNSLILMDADRVTRSLKRITYQIAESNKKDKPVVLLGINERGFLIAGRLGAYLSAVYSSEVKTLRLIVEADDEAETQALEETELADKFLVLVDDVIFSGSTMFKALKLLSGYLELEEVHTVALIDRGHRKLPVDAQFVGLDLPTKLNEHVSLAIEGDTIQRVQLSTA